LVSESSAVMAWVPQNMMDPSRICDMTTTIISEAKNPKRSMTQGMRRSTVSPEKSTKRML
jgi:hypothetical protein